MRLNKNQYADQNSKEYGQSFVQPNVTPLQTHIVFAITMTAIVTALVGYNRSARSDNIPKIKVCKHTQPSLAVFDIF